MGIYSEVSEALLIAEMVKRRDELKDGAYHPDCFEVQVPVPEEELEERTEEKGVLF